MRRRVLRNQDLVAFIEIPKGSRNKYEYDEESGRLVLDRFLSASTVFPTDYGHLIGHRGSDGDLLDALVCVSAPTFSGCAIAVKAIALFKMRDEAGHDDKIVCVPINDPTWGVVENLRDLPAQLRLEITHFFSIYKDLEDKVVEVDGWHDREEALAIIDDAKRRFDVEPVPTPEARDA